MQAQPSDYFFSVQRAASVLFKGKKPFFINIGANDGVVFDPVFEYVMPNGWPGILIEPIPEAVRKLSENYKNHPGGVSIVQAAVAEYNGSITMRRVDPKKEADIGVWAPYIAEIKNHRTPYNLSQQSEVAPYMVDVECECKTLQTILDECHATKLDLIEIDTEGYDYMVLKQVDFARYKPSIIHFEYAQLPDQERGAVKMLLRDHGYVYVLTNLKDMLAIPKSKLLSLMSESEFTRYEGYLDKKYVRSKSDLIHAVALLGQLISCLTSTTVVSSKVSFLNLQNYQDVFRDRDTFSSNDRPLRKPVVTEAIDAVSQMRGLFTSELHFTTFLEKEMPPLYFRQK
jgi:FkbM family methyltransferase